MLTFFYFYLRPNTKSINRNNSSFKASMRMPECQLDDYIESIRYLKEKYKDQISILIGLECEYFERYMPWLEKMLEDKKNIKDILEKDDVVDEE